MESLQIIHRDLCANNVLVDANKVAKLSDFGMAICLKEGFQSKHNLNSAKIRIKWTAPESLGGKMFSFKSDVWSFGIFVWELFSYGRMPYPRTQTEFVESFLLSGHRMSAPDYCPRQMYELMKKCWKLNNLDRPSFELLKYEIVLLI